MQRNVFQYIYHFDGTFADVRQFIQEYYACVPIMRNRNNIQKFNNKLEIE